MRYRRGEGSNLLFNLIMVALLVLSVAYVLLYYWPHSQGRASVLDKYVPAARRVLEKMGFASKTKVTDVGVEQGATTGKPASTARVRHEIEAGSEWINSTEIASVTASGRSVAVTVRAKMSNEEALAATREIFMIVFKKVPEVASLRVMMRVKARVAPGPVRDFLRSDIMMTRSTYSRVNWDSLSPKRLPGVADRAKLYFKL